MKFTVQSMDGLPCYDASLNCSYEDEYDFSAGDELNHTGSPVDIVPQETNAACGDSSYDNGNDKAENDVLSDMGQEKRPSANMPDANERPLQLPTKSTRDCSSDKRQNLETGASSQQLPNDEKYWSILDETSTWSSYACAQQPNSFTLHQLPLSRSTTLNRRHNSVIYVNDLCISRSNAVKSTANRVVASSAEAEVIDLMTPSPDSKARILSKKKRDPSIIDLTRSPNFVQL